MKREYQHTLQRHIIKETNEQTMNILFFLHNIILSIKKKCIIYKIKSNKSSQYL